jgi:predicted DNA-binding WGR domain protein
MSARIVFFTDRSESLLAKATTTKTISVPGYTRKNGTFVPPHTKTVHYDPDKTVSEVLYGHGSHSQKKALKKLSKAPGWHDLPAHHKHAHVLSLATNLQKKDSASASVSGWKKAAMAGKNPTPSQWAAFTDADAAKKQELVDKVSDKFGNVAHLKNPEVPFSDKSVEVTAPAEEPSDSGVAGWEHAALALGSPTASEWAAFNAASDDEKKAIAGKVYAKFGHFSMLLDPAVASALDQFGSDEEPEKDAPADAAGVVTDGSGNPEVFYHGGKDVEASSLSPLTFFTTDKSVAQDYLDGGTQAGEGKVHAATLSIKNPATDTDVENAAKKVGIYDASENPHQYLTESVNGDDALAVAKELQKEGFDGAKLTDMPMKGGDLITSWVVFDSSQIHPAPEEAESGVADKFAVGSTFDLSPDWVDELPDGTTVNVGEFTILVGDGKAWTVLNNGMKDKLSNAAVSMIGDGKLEKTATVLSLGDEIPGDTPDTPPKPVGQPAVADNSAKIKEHLDQMPWSSLELPESNTNAKSVNKKLAKIKDAAYAGDVAALQAMKFGKNSYNKKLAKIAETAIAGLEDLDGSPKDGDTKPAADGGTLVLKDGRWHKQDDGAPKHHVVGSADDPAYMTLSNGPNAKAAYAKIWTTGKVAHVEIGKIGEEDDADESTHSFASDEQANDYARGIYDGHLKAGFKDAANPTDDSPKGGDADKAVDSEFESVDGIFDSAPEVPALDIPDADSWEKISGKKGSNDGGTFKDPDGQSWYVKRPDHDDIAKNEVLANHLYAATGVKVPETKLVNYRGKLCVASRWIDGLEKKSADDLSMANGTTSGFAVDAWLANWDVVGLGYDNLLVDEGLNAVRLDQGGSLLYRAQGEAKGKEFGDTVDELKTLLDSNKNSQSASVFGGLSKHTVKAGVGKVLAVSPDDIKKMCLQYGPGSAADRANLAKKLIARQMDLAQKFPSAKGGKAYLSKHGEATAPIKPKAKSKTKSPKFNPDGLSAPPDFMNWGGKGTGGPSSKPYINKANDDAVKALHEAAKTGDPAAIKALQIATMSKGDNGSDDLMIHVLVLPNS